MVCICNALSSLAMLIAKVIQKFLDNTMLNDEEEHCIRIQNVIFTDIFFDHIIQFDA